MIIIFTIFGKNTHAVLSSTFYTCWNVKHTPWELFIDPTIPPLGLYPDKTIIWTDTCTLMFIAALFTIAKTWKQPKCSSTEELKKKMQYVSVQFSSVAQLCPTLCNPMNCSMPGLPVHQQLPEFTQTHVHQVGDAIQPSHPLSSPSSPALNLSQHQGLFKWVSSLHQVAKVLEFQLQHQSFQWTPRTDLL